MFSSSFLACCLLLLVVAFLSVSNGQLNIVYYHLAANGWIIVVLLTVFVC